MKILDIWANNALVHDFLWEAGGHGVYDGKQPWKQREADDHRLQRDKLEREKLICSGEGRLYRKERDIHGVPVIIPSLS